MTDWEVLERFLQTDPVDVGCEQSMHVLHIYVELVLANATGSDAVVTGAARRYPGVAAHLLACGPCAEDYRGLLTAARHHRH